MISKKDIQNKGYNSIEEYYDYITECYHLDKKELAVQLVSKANDQQRAKYYLGLLTEKDYKALSFFLHNDSKL